MKLYYLPHYPDALGCHENCICIRMGEGEGRLFRKLSTRCSERIFRPITAWSIV